MGCLQGFQMFGIELCFFLFSYLLASLPGLIPRRFPRAARWLVIPEKEPVSFPWTLAEVLGRVSLAWLGCHWLGLGVSHCS